MQRRCLLTEHSAGVFQNRGQRGVVRCRVINMACKAHGGIEALEIEVVFQ